MAHIFNFVFLFYLANYVLCPLFTPSPCLWLLPVDKGGHKARFLPTCFFSMIFVLPTNELSFFLRPFWHSSKSFCEIEEHFLGSEATWFLSPHLDLFFFQKNLLYEDDGIL